MTATALTRGSESAEYLLLEDWQRNAVVHVAVQMSNRSEIATCSGVLVGPTEVLTAAHCVTGAYPASVQISFGPNADTPRFRAAARDVQPHTDRDLAIVILEDYPSDEIDVLPLGLSFGDEPRVGSLVQLAGFGIDANGISGNRRFAVAEVSAIHAAEVTVTSHGYGGACAGDSGGPALWRGSDGEVTVLGLLSKGIVSCYGTDRYMRFDDVRLWLAQWITEPQQRMPANRPYDAMDFMGRCFDGTAVWLEGMALVAEHCSATYVCGWSKRELAYRCIDAEEDACDGIIAQGICHGESAVRCLKGQLREDPCGACGWKCARSPLSGEAVCSASAKHEQGM